MRRGLDDAERRVVREALEDALDRAETAARGTNYSDRGIRLAFEIRTIEKALDELDDMFVEAK